MPYKRPTLTELRQRNQAFIQTELKKIGTLLCFSNLKILGDADAGLSYLHYGYLDWIAKQAVPFTATDDFLSAWGALKAVTQKSVTAATGPSNTFTGIAGTIIPAGTVLNRSDGYQYTVDDAVIIGSSGSASGAITAVLPDVSTDITGGGTSGNADAGTILTIGKAIAGINSEVTVVEAITGGR